MPDPDVPESLGTPRRPGPPRTDPEIAADIVTCRIEDSDFNFLGLHSMRRDEVPVAFRLRGRVYLRGARRTFTELEIEELDEMTDPMPGVADAATRQAVLDLEAGVPDFVVVPYMRRHIVALKALPEGAERDFAIRSAETFLSSIAAAGAASGSKVA